MQTKLKLHVILSLLTAFSLLTFAQGTVLTAESDKP